MYIKNKLKHKIVLLTGLLSLIFLVNFVNSEMFTAISEMEELLETEAVLVGNLQAYISAHEEKLNFLKR